MRKIACLFASMASCCIISAQINDQKGIRLNRLTIQDGLPEGHIECIIQDKEGYMWMGTRNGIVRYDGYTTRVYHPFYHNKNPFRIKAFCEDTHGTLWVGTAFHGVGLYDRKKDEFICYQTNSTDRNSLAPGEIEGMLADGHDNLWLTILRRDKNNQKSIDCLNTKTRQFRHYGTEKTSGYTDRTYLAPLFKDRKGNIWSGSENGLMEFDYTHDCFMPHIASVITRKKKTVDKICADPLEKGTVWLTIKNTQTGTLEGLLRYNLITKAQKVFHHIRNDPASLASDSVYDIQTDSMKHLWIATGNGFSLFDPYTERFSNYIPGNNQEHPNINLIPSFRADKKGNLWFITYPGLFNLVTDYGLFSLNTVNKKFTRYKEEQIAENGLSKSKKRNLFIDRSGNIWFSSSSQGIEWINERKSRYTKYTVDPLKRNGFTGGILTASAEAPDLTIWMATDQGLYHWFPLSDSFAVVKLGKTPLNSPISAVAVDKTGLVWYAGDEGSTLKGIYCYDPFTKKVKNYRQNPSIPDNWNDVIAMMEDHAGFLWVGTWGGLCKFNKESKTFTLCPNKSTINATTLDTFLANDAALSLYEAKNQTLWVGIHGNSLNKFNRVNGDFTSYETAFPHFQFVSTIFEDSKGRIWAGSYRDGLIVLDAQSKPVKQITEKEGLLFNGVGNILEDKQGNLWIKSARGISILDSTASTIRNLTDDILEEKNHVINTSLKTSKGLFVFPSKYGFVTLDPDDFGADTITPIVHIETVAFYVPKTDSKRERDSVLTRWGHKDFRLRYNENRLKFNFVGLLYQNTGQITYKYRLDGYDQNWVSSGAQRTAIYNNLVPGIYTFHVNAANSDGVWSKEEDSLVVIVSPPWWQMKWFRTVVIITIAALVFLTLQFYLKRRLKTQKVEFERLQEIEKIRSKISMDIHDEISSGLTKISLLSQRVKNRFVNNREIEPEMIDKITASSKEVIENLGEIIWAVNPKHDNLQSLLSYLRNYIAAFFEQTSIEPALSFPDEVEDISISPDIKHHLFLVTKEALNNIVKHAAASRVELLFENIDDRYTFTITDNGKGMNNLNGRALGNGLTNMEKRMKAINGTFNIHSQPERGTKIVFKGKFT